MEDLKQLTHKRGQLKASLTRFRNYFNAFTELQDARQLRLRLSKFEGCLQQYEDIQSSIEYQDQSQAQVDEREEFESNYFDLMTEVESFLARRPGTFESTNDELQTRAQVKLPTLNLPTFNGSYDQWLPFHDTFHSVIHSNTSLTNIQKFHYLMSALKSDAAQVVQSLEISSNNYDTAWSLLKQRYENKRWIMQNHIKALFELPCLTRESPIGLRQLLDNTLKHIRALKSLKQPVEFWDALLIHLTTSKFDPVTRREWESSLTEDETTMEQLVKFLTCRCQLLEVLSAGRTGSKSSQDGLPFYKNSGSSRAGQAATSHLASHKLSNCHVCNQSHPLFKCSEFLKLNPDRRLQKVRSLRLCVNCLREGHQGSRCDAGTCKKCSKRHNMLLHLNPADATAQNQNEAQTEDVSNNTAAIANHIYNKNPQPYIVLSTAIVGIYDNQGVSHLCRALLDSGSQVNFITKTMCQRLGLKLTPSNSSIIGINLGKVGVNQSVKASIKSRFNAFKADLSCLVLPKITSNLPSITFGTVELKIPENLKLADPQFNISAEIDLLIGAELFCELLCVGQIRISKSLPILQKTHLGWIVSGAVNFNQDTSSAASSCHITLVDQLSQFWKLEECSTSTTMTREECLCEEHYTQTFKREASGRFIVMLPFKQEAKPLGDSREVALKRFYAVERRLAKQPELKHQYVEFMKEYLMLGHMEEANIPTDASQMGNYFLPHHAVIKDSSLTTKLRVVFDGSCKTSTGVSLNDRLMVGPTIQQDIFALLTRFRIHQYVLTADIMKMYRQVRVDDMHTQFQLIFWREDQDLPLNIFRLKTVTYGTASAPFLATRCLQQLALEGEQQFPLASTAIMKDFYVDDLLTGTNTLEEALVLQKQLDELLSSAGFHLRKWASNEPKVLKGIQENAVGATMLHLNDNGSNKILGLMWNSGVDTLEYVVQPPKLKTCRITKRSILSTIAHIFDPMGLVGPVILKAKMLMQKLWQVQIDWDESIPLDLHTEWTRYEQQLPMLNTLAIPRKVIGDTDHQLHGFCDASEVAYGACLYLRSTDTYGKSMVRLLCSKSKVAPLKSVSLPRLELCGALLLARLASKTISTLGIHFDRLYFWSDSTIVLAWLTSPSNTWKTFVANRVAEIQDLTQPQDWNHISTFDNPADHVSRGLLPVQLLDLSVWWYGPSWLSADSSQWPRLERINTLNLPEKRCTISMITTQTDSTLFEKYSSLSRLQRVMAYCLRFITNSKRQAQDHLGVSLSSSELRRALERLIKLTQDQEFKPEIQALKDKGRVSSRSKMLSLHPFLDIEGIIRVGGRLQQAPITYAHKHPILLPANHRLTRLIIHQEHLKQLHAGPQLLLATIRRKFWPLSARNMVRQIVRSCVTCFRARPTSSEQIMGQLPQSRITPSHPFQCCGVDYCGPFQLRLLRRRGTTTFKTYLAIFVCFTTKAVHLELASDLSTEGFLSVLQRFTARRGKCQHIYSDNATNFVGARNELAEIQRHFASNPHQQAVTNHLSADNISWHFIPARSPHFGGLWEAAVKSAKHHIKRVAGEASLTMNEMCTLSCQIEACLNSRPLTPMSNDPSDLEVLTPGHFLIGQPLTAIPEPNYTTTSSNRLSHYQHVQQLLQHFWTRWSKEYLSSLQDRSKWKKQNPNLIIPGALVLIKDDQLPPLKWARGRVVQLHPGTDGLVRVASVHTVKGTVKRATTKLCVLPIDTKDSTF